MAANLARLQLFASRTAAREGAMQTEIHAVTRELRAAAVDLLVRFFREEGFTTPPPRIAENLDRMLSDSSCWCAVAVVDGEARAVITVSTVLYVEWGRLGEIGDLHVHSEHRRKGLARRLVEHAKAWCRTQGCSALSERPRQLSMSPPSLPSSRPTTRKSSTGRSRLSI